MKQQKDHAALPDKTLPQTELDESAGLADADFGLRETQAIDFDQFASYGLPLIVDYCADTCIPCNEMALFLAMLAGILTSVTPCLLSGIPLIIGYVGGVGGKSTKRAFAYSAVFSLGTAVTFVALGIMAASAGKLMGIQEEIIMGLFGFGKKKEEEKKAPACCGEPVDSICCTSWDSEEDGI